MGSSGSLGSTWGTQVGIPDGLDLIQPNGLDLQGLLALFDLIRDVHAIRALDELHQLVGILANNHRPKMAGHVVPGNALPVLVVEDGETGLVVILLQALDGDADVKLGLDRSFGETLKVVGLRVATLSHGTPVGVSGVLVGGSDSLVSGSGPEPTVHVDWLQVLGVATLALEVAFPAGGVNGAHVVLLHNGLEKLEFFRSVKADEIHAPVSAEVSAVEPIPVLELVPGFPPGHEVVVASPFHV